MKCWQQVGQNKQNKSGFYQRWGSIEEDNLELALKKESNLGLIQSLIKLIAPKYGFELEIYSDFPSNSGLGAQQCATFISSPEF